MASETLLRVAELALALERPQTMATLKGTMVEAAALFEQPFYLFGTRGGVAGSTGQPVEMALTNYPPVWMMEYDREKLVRVDPVLRRINSEYGSFRWDEIEVDDEEKEFVVKRGQAGMLHGFGVATAGPYGAIGTVMFSGPAPIPRECWRGWACAVGLLGGAVTRAAIAMKTAHFDPSTKPVELTGHQRQVLELTAQGLTAQGVADVLRLPGERQVRYILDTAAEKLGVKRAEAPAEALHRGLIRKRHFGDPRFASANQGQ